jgi:hypothetical protein
MIVKKNKKVVFSKTHSKLDSVVDKKHSFYYAGHSKEYGTIYNSINPDLSDSEYTVNKQNTTGVDLADV